MAENLWIKISIHYIPGGCLKSYLGIVPTSIYMFTPAMSGQSRVIPYPCILGIQRGSIKLVVVILVQTGN